jgi:GNAT superfamily N-acetyltransferase
MNAEFTTPFDQKPGIIASLLGQAYADLVKSDPSLWEPEQENWEQYDREVFGQPISVGACVFLTRLDGRVVGFGSWDPRQRPYLGIIGHNCVLPEFRGRGLGKRQIQEILRRFREMAIETAKASTSDHPFFVPAQRMYATCGFREVRRILWDRDPKQRVIEYEKRICQPLA